MGQSYFDAGGEDANVFVEFHLSGKIYQLESFSTSISQDTSADNLEPKSEVTGGLLEISMLQVPDKELLQWAASKWIKKNGEFVFKNETTTPILRISFEDAVCVNFTQSCSEGLGSSISMTISPRIVSFNGFSIEKNWEE